MLNQEWLLTDLHMHSQYSSKRKSGDKDKVREMQAQEFVEIIKAKEVKIFSITDHNYFSDSYYEEVEEYIKSKHYDMKLINGIEFDVFASEEDDEFVHICFYFDDNLNRKLLHEKVEELYSKSIPNLFQIIQSMESLKVKFIIIPHGDKDRGIFKKVLRNNYIGNNTEIYKYAMYKIFNAYDVSAKFYEKSINHWAANFFSKTKTFKDIIDSLDEQEIENLQKKLVSKIKDDAVELCDEEKEVFDYMIKYGSYYAYFSFSDWHNKSEYNPQINNFIFGKLKNSFEAIEMATLDPESRIIQSSDTTIEISSSILKEITFTIDEKKKEIEFSPGLNAIVGKRGSGKSLLISIIRNLKDKNDPEGALTVYKKLNIGNIQAKDRGDINISLGGLNSVEILSQNDISDIFDNPINAQKRISEYFPIIIDYDKTKLNFVLTLLDKIKPFDNNYKNVTNSIKNIKKSDSFQFTEYKVDSSVNFDKSFDDIIVQMDTLSRNIKKFGINNERLNNLIDSFSVLKKYYLNMILLDKSMLKVHNETITEINKELGENKKLQLLNKKAIEEAKEIIISNLDIKLQFKKIKYYIEHLVINNPPVNTVKKGKYLFATYFEIPSDLKELIIENIAKSLNRGQSIDDIEKYINGEKELKKGKSLDSNYKEFINGDLFKKKQSFFEIVNTSIDYEKNINSMEDIEEYVKRDYLIDLTQASLGTKSVAYLDMLFDLDCSILVLDQPEDNIDNDYISNYLVPSIKKNKKIKQLIFVTHNPSVAVYGDAFNYIFVENTDKINYNNYYIENQRDKDELIKILEGGKGSFSNRNKKFGNILGDEEYGNN